MEEVEGEEDEDTEILMKITFDNKKTEKVDVVFYLQTSYTFLTQITVILIVLLKPLENSIPKFKIILT